MYQFDDFCLIVFSKAPENGRVKTRMQPTLPAEFSLDLHCALVDYCLSQWSAAKLMPIQLWYAGERAGFLQHLPQWAKYANFPQQGADLGERMAYAAEKALATSRSVILVGTDCPFIDEKYLIGAVRALKDHDVVLGPAEDGGYVLIGLNGFWMPLFESIQWGEASVFQETQQAIESQQLTHYCLSTLSDVDRPEDIRHLKKLDAFKTLLRQWHITLG